VDHITVLISGAGTATCQSVIKGLRAQDEYSVRIITVDMSPGNAGRYFSDAFYEVPAARSPDFIPTLLKICQSEDVDLVIPIVDYEFDALALARRQFADIGCRVVISDPAVITACNDKWETFQFFRNHDIPTARTWLPQHLPLDEVSYPLIIKPRFMGRGSLDTYRVTGQAELEIILTKVDHPLIQECLTGIEHTTDVLCDFNGQAVNAVVRERTETKSGVSYKGKTVADAEILDLAVRIAEGLPIVGPANIQCFKNDRGVFFTEVNPRSSGTLVLSIAAGFNSPLYLLRLARGQRVRPCVGHYAVGVRMLRYWQEVFVDEAGAVLPPLALTAANTEGEPALTMGA
jgi:carbamoyl-phosphate synthase large subunit